MRGEILLEVKVSYLDVSGRREKITELVVEDNLATVLGVLKTLLSDVLVNKLGNLGAQRVWLCRLLQVGLYEPQTILRLRQLYYHDQK